MDNKKIKKPFYKKWWIWVIAIIVIIFVWGGSGSSNTSNTAANKDSKTTESNKIVKLGEETKAGNIGVKVLEVKEQNSISNEAGKANATCKFVILKLELKNNGNEATEYNPHEFKLNDDKKTLEVDDNSFDALGHLNSQETIYKNNKKFIGSYDKYNAGLSKNTYLVFDVPKDSKLENLKLTVEGAKNTQLNLK
ncbi:hypothetical protein ADU80_05020 [Clostridium botulinum]|uniref:DUF4352 domain-containing protein n=2 Tax=Clostridium botulinum TaxID=1491 RepID=UPI0002FAD8AB|nr:DUF4352 domain-containing protein [Clostridium botulinum]KLU74184.1 hypothetical protein CBC3_p0324 [Clostridium botulinum V891]KOA86422.1 hypothetical protein ADU80_05020 [Clostridium botulinum]KOC34077.1 hypothetical protein ADU82_10880 [Clostridium botulinum]MCD3211037.1 DUF4352 domain-containing protein [Clostridium botulinum C/D]MCD3259803.1 DUF4352 domain-containing protein [Clostridium botulinum C/D]